MKKLSLILIGLFVLSFYGCRLTDEAVSLKEDVQKSYENIAEETEKVVEGVKETKEKARVAYSAQKEIYNPSSWRNKSGTCRYCRARNWPHL